MKYRLTKDDWSAYTMLAPFYLFFLVFVIAPIVVCVVISLTRYNLSSIRFVGLENYRFLLQDEIFFKSVGNTLYYAVFTMIPVLLLGLILANILNSKRVLGRGVFRTLIYIPYIPSMVSISLIWLWMYDPASGVFNVLLRLIKLKPQNWLYDPSLAMACIILMSAWRLIGYVMIIYMAALQAIPESIFDAAVIDGAGPVRRLVSVVVPMLRPTTFFLVVTLSIQSFSVFEQVNVMTQGAPLNSTTTIVHQIYQRSFYEVRYGYGSAIAVLLFALVAIITFINFRYGKEAYDAGAAY